MKYAVFCVLWLWVGTVIAQDASEIWVFDLVETEGNLVLQNGNNVTGHPGYDNQPFFHPSRPWLLYSSFNEDGRSEIKAFILESGTTKQLTETSEREYSPTVTLDGSSFSCIIQRDDGAQDLGKYPLDGGEAEVLIDDLIVGYHAWMDEQRLLLFVLGDVMTLRIYDLKSGTHETIAENPGRSLHRIPGENAMSFVDKSSEDLWIIKRLDNDTLEISELADTLPEHEDIAWTPDAKILSSDGTKVFLLDPAGDAGWQELSLDHAGLKDITRLAVSSDGRQVAVVAAEN